MTRLYDDPLCAQTDPELFFPEAGDAGVVRQAKRVCMACDHRLECLEDALEEDRGQNVYGIRGGLTGRERRDLRARRNAKKKAAVA